MLRWRGQGEPGTARCQDGRDDRRLGEGTRGGRAFDDGGSVCRVAGEGGGRVVRWGAVLGSAEEGRESEREEDDKLREAFGSAKAFERREERAAKEDEEQGCRAGGCAEEAEDGQRLVVES